MTEREVRVAEGRQVMLAYHNDPALKAKLLEGLQAHAAADEIVKGTYWQKGRGCAVGCASDVLGLPRHNDHEALAEATGIPVMLHRLQDRIFEGLPLAEAKTWPIRFSEAAEPGADLSLVGWQFLAWLVEDVLERHGNDAVRAGCAAALDVVQRKARGEDVASEAADAAAAAARLDAAVAAEVVVGAAWAARAASEAAEVAAWETSEAARAAAEAADAAYSRQSEKLLELMRAA